MSAYDDLIVLDRAVAHWPLDEPTGSTAADISGHGHDATLYNSPTMGVSGPASGQSAMDFSATAGHNPYGVIALPAQLPTVPGSCTWECWVKIPASATDNSTPFSLANNSSSYTGYFVALQPGAPASIFVGRYGGSSSADDAGADTPTLMDGTWHHVAFANAGGGGASALYLDGVPLALTFSDAFVTALAADAALLAGDAEGYDPTYSYEGRFTGALAHVALYDYALTACQVKSHYDLATTGSYTPCADWLRLMHSSGKSHIQQSGAAIQMRANDADVLDLPLPILAGTPATLLGKDPATGLPAFCPAPIPATTTVVLGGGGGSQPAPAPQCVQVRCGVSGACRDHLVSLYQDWSHWLDPLFQAAATFGVAVAVATVPWDWLLDLEAGAVIKSGVVTLLQGFGSAITGNVLPVLDQDLQTDIQRALFDHLTCMNDQVQVSADSIAAWKAALDALTTWPIASLAGPFCSLLLQYTPLARWQAAASTASPSTACDAWP